MPKEYIKTGMTQPLKAELTLFSTERRLFNTYLLQASKEALLQRLLHGQPEPEQKTNSAKVRNLKLKHSFNYQARPQEQTSTYDTMTNKNVLFKKSENDGDEYEYFGSQCFQINPNVVEREIPTNGEEYLLKVMKERAKCATVTRCKLDVSKLYKNSDTAGTEDAAENGSSKLDKLKPTIEWQNIQIADFSDLHMYVIRMAARKKDSLPSIFQETYKDFTKDGGILWKKVFESTEPTLSHVVGLTHAVVESGLETILSLLQKVKLGDSIDRRTGLWLHALLTVTRHPPQSDDSFVLRNLCRRCAEIRAGLNLDDENAKELATPLNIFICIIAKYFGQHDLGDYELQHTKVGQIYFDTKIKQIIYE